jgi:hypothetical protein
MVLADVNGDAIADFALSFNNGVSASLTATDFIF